MSESIPWSGEVGKLHQQVARPYLNKACRHSGNDVNVLQVQIEHGQFCPSENCTDILKF